MRLPAQVRRCVLCEAAHANKTLLLLKPCNGIPCEEEDLTCKCAVYGQLTHGILHHPNHLICTANEHDSRGETERWRGLTTQIKDALDGIGCQPHTIEEIQAGDRLVMRIRRIQNPRQGVIPLIHMFGANIPHMKFMNIGTDIITIGKLGFLERFRVYHCETSSIMQSGAKDSPLNISTLAYGGDRSDDILQEICD